MQAEGRLTRRLVPLIAAVAAALRGRQRRRRGHQLFLDQAGAVGGQLDLGVRDGVVQAQRFDGAHGGVHGRGPVGVAQRRREHVAALHEPRPPGQALVGHPDHVGRPGRGHRLDPRVVSA